MSFPTSWITCEKCQKTYSGDFASGEYVYELPDGMRLPLERQLGWCDDCWSLVEMEDLGSDEIRQELESLRSQLEVANRGIAKFLPAKRREVATLKSKIANLAPRYSHQLSRRSSEKCLRCGSPHVSPLPKLNWPSKSGVYVRNSWTHPGCGGTMLTHGDDVHFSETSPRVIYDQEGTFVREEDRGW